MSSLHAQFPEYQKPLKGSRADVESSTYSHHHHHLHLHPAPTINLTPVGSLNQVSWSETPSCDSFGSLTLMDERDETMDDVVIPRRYGSVSLIGRRREMEDAITVAPLGLPFGYEFFAVYAGQGGPKVAKECKARLHRILAEEIVSYGAGDEAGGRSVSFNWSSIMKAGFLRMDDELIRKFPGGNRGRDGDDGLDDRAVSETETTGSTVTVVVVGEEEIVVANCGHSRAVLFTSGRTALQLSRDDQSDSSIGQQGMEATGGESSGDFPILISIGHHPCLFSEPEVRVYRRTEIDEFLIVATHGLWDVVSNEDACQVAKNSLDGQIKRSLEENLVKSPAVAATTLAEFAMARGSKDNISLIIVEL